MKKNVVDEINKDAGKVIAFAGSDVDQAVEAMPTGMIPLDQILGIGGLPKGRIIEIHGLQSSAKTSMCLAMVAKYQQEGISCAFVDAEYALNIQHAKSYGVDTDTLTVIQPDCGEEAFEAVEKLVKGGVQFIVIDSASALVPKGEIEAEFGKPTMGGQARLISQGLRRLVGPISKNNSTVIFINQMRANIMGGQYDPYIVTGGMALRFYATIILELKKDKAVMKKEGGVDKLKGYNIKVLVRKNKVGKPGETCLVQLLFEGGFSAEADLLSLGLESGAVTRLGNTYYMGDIKLGVGANRAQEYFLKNPEQASLLRNQLSPTP